MTGLIAGIVSTRCYKRAYILRVAKQLQHFRVFPAFLVQNTVVALIIALRVNLVWHLVSFINIEVAGKNQTSNLSLEEG